MPPSVSNAKSEFLSPWGQPKLVRGGPENDIGNNVEAGLKHDVEASFAR